MSDTTNRIAIVVEDQVASTIVPKLIAMGDAADGTGKKLGSLKEQLRSVNFSSLNSQLDETTASSQLLSTQSEQLINALQSLTASVDKATAGISRKALADRNSTVVTKENTAATLSQGEAYATARIAGGAMAGSTNMMLYGFARLGASVPLVTAALNAAFPIVIAAAFVDVVYQVGDGLYKMYRNAMDAAHNAAIAFDSIIDPLRKTNDTLAVTNDKLDATISKLEHLPTTNGAQTAIDQAREAADRLDTVLEKVNTDLDKILTKNRIGIVQSILTGQSPSKDTEQFIRSQFDTVDEVRKNAEQALDRASALRDPKAAQTATIAAYENERKAIQGTIDALNDKWNVLNGLQRQHDNPVQIGSSLTTGSPIFSNVQDQTRNMTAVGEAVRLAQQDLRGLDETMDNIKKNAVVDHLRDQTSGLKVETKQAAKEWKDLEASYIAFQRSITDAGSRPTAQQELAFLVGKESTINPLNASRLQAKEQPLRNAIAGQTWKSDETSKLKDQISTIGLYSDALKEASDLNRILEEARKRNIALTPEEINGYRSLISQIVESTDYTKALQRIYSDINQPLHTYLGSLDALRTLYQRGQLTGATFLQGLVETTKQYSEATDAVAKYQNELNQQQRDASNLLGSDYQNAVAEQLNALDRRLRQPNADATHPFGYSESEITRVNNSLRETIAAQQEKNRVDQAANAIIQQQTNLQDKLATQNAANAIAVRHGALSQQAANLQRLHGQAQINQLQLANGTGGNPFAGALLNLTQFKTTAQQIQDAFKPVFKTLSDGFADSIGRAIVDAQNLGKALKEVARSAVAELISGLIKLAIEFAVVKAGEKFLHIKSSGESAAASIKQQAALTAASLASMAIITGASLASASALSAVWWPVAEAVSLASFGANSIGAATGIGAVMAMGSVASVPKFAVGTNYVPRDMYAHIHKGERIIPAADNTALMTALNAGVKQPQRGPNTTPGHMRVEVHNHGSSSIKVEQMTATHVRLIVRDEVPQMIAQQAPSVIANDIANPNSKTSKALSRNVTPTRIR